MNIVKMINTHFILFPIMIFTVHLFHISRSIECSGSKEEYGCEANEYGNYTICSGGLYETDEARSRALSILVLCSWPKESFDPTILSSFTGITNFTLIRSHVTRFSKDFPSIPQLKILNLSRNHIEFLDFIVFSKLTSLILIDLRFNNLHYFSTEHIFDLPNLQKLYLSDNQWKCNENMLWIVHKNCSLCSKVIDLDLMKCNEDKYKNKPLKIAMTMLQTLIDECVLISNHCTCILDHIIIFKSTTRPMITVNCSNQNLSTLPHPIPQFTSTLIVKGNKISDLSPFVNDHAYLNLLNAYLDDNNITSISVLENSSWLLTFRALSLRDNDLSEVPIYALEAALEKNPNVGNLFLSMNPWRCDCVFTPVFQTFLAKYRAVIKDIDEVKCSPSDNDETSLVPILLLSRDKVCGEKSKVSIWKIVNLCLILLLAVLLCDFLYNYYMYKRYGKLPWIARKLP